MKRGQGTYVTHMNEKHGAKPTQGTPAHVENEYRKIIIY